LKEAEKCEEDGSPRTCEAIVKSTVSMEVEEEDRLETWMGDAENAEGKGRVGTARAILAYALKVFPDRKRLWWKAAELEKAHGTRYMISSQRYSGIPCLQFVCNSGILSMPFWNVPYIIVLKQRRYG
jgi:hypothetical protein